MERGIGQIGGSITSDILRWKAVKGGVNSDGSPVQKPPNLEFAELIDGICQRYGQLPSKVLEEDVMMLQILEAVSLLEDTKSGTK